jgi:hypothetical protein
MTGYTVHTGSTEKFSQSWDKIFGKKNLQSRQKTTKKTTPSNSKRSKKTK